MNLAYFPDERGRLLTEMSIMRHDLNKFTLITAGAAQWHDYEILKLGINKNQNVVIIEDLISTGKSSLNAYKALKSESISVNGIIAIFDYGFKTSAQIFAENKILVHSLSNYDYLIKYALKKDFISSSQVELLSNWKNDPSNWNK